MEAALTNIEDLKGEALDSALDGVGLLEGNKSKSVDEKRELLQDYVDRRDSEGTVDVRVAWPVDSFDSGIDGIGVIGSEYPTPVSKDQLDALHEAAKSADTTLIVRGA